MSHSSSRTRLPALLPQAMAPGMLTSRCDFPLQDLPETVLKKRQAPHLAQKSSRQLAPCPRPCCAAPFVTQPVLISSPHIHQVPLSQSRFCRHKQHQTDFPYYARSSCFLSAPDLSHSLPPSLLQAHIFSLPPASTVRSCGRWTQPARLQHLLRQQVLLSCFPTLGGQEAAGVLASADHLAGTHGRAGKAGQQGRASRHCTISIRCNRQRVHINELEVHLGSN